MNCPLFEVKYENTNFNTSHKIATTNVKYLRLNLTTRKN